MAILIASIVSAVSSVGLLFELIPFSKDAHVEPITRNYFLSDDHTDQERD